MPATAASRRSASCARASSPYLRSKNAKPVSSTCHVSVRRHPLPVGSQIRMRAEIASADEVKPGQVHVVTRLTV